MNAPGPWSITHIRTLHAHTFAPGRDEAAESGGFLDSMSNSISDLDEKEKKLRFHPPSS